MKLLWFIFKEISLAYLLKCYIWARDHLTYFCCILAITLVHLLNAVLYSSRNFRYLHPFAQVTRTYPWTVTFLNVVHIWLHWHFPYFLKRFLDKGIVVQLPLRTETHLFLALCKQRLQNSHIYKLFNFQMLIKSLAPSAGCASAT